MQTANLPQSPTIDLNSRYVFEFRWQDANNQTQLRKRRVPLADLWQKFNLAADWRRAGRPSEVRTVSFYGPGISRSLCDEMARDHLREVLEPLGLVPLEPAYCGLLWAWLSDSDGYVLYKIRQESVALDGFEKPYLVTYGLEQVEADKIEVAFYWSIEKCWFSRGVWINDRPGLAFMGNHLVAWKALEECPRVSRHFIDGHLPLAKVRYDFKGKDNRYPYMAPTRSRPRIQDLRSRYPRATEDLAVVPASILQRDYGYGLPTGISPSPAFAG